MLQRLWHLHPSFTLFHHLFFRKQCISPSWIRLKCLLCNHRDIKTVWMRWPYQSKPNHVCMQRKLLPSLSVALGYIQLPFYWRNLDDVGTVQWHWWIKKSPCQSGPPQSKENTIAVMSLFWDLLVLSLCARWKLVHVQQPQRRNRQWLTMNLMKMDRT